MSSINPLNSIPIFPSPPVTTSSTVSPVVADQTTSAATPSTASTNSNPPVTNSASVGFSSNLPQRFIDEIVKPVSGYDPRSLGVQVTIEADTLGRPVLNLIHSHRIKGEEKSFNYRIVFSGEKYDLPARIILGETNVVTLPVDALDDEKKTKTQDAFRALTISDPKLYKRFNPSGFELADYQLEAVDKGLRSLEERKAAMIVMPTGTGKTVVAWDLMDKYLNRARIEGQKVLFIVNNKLILDGAQKKLKQQFGEKYSTSQVYDQVTDCSGDVIFTTPASLNTVRGEDGKTKLNELLNNNLIAMAIYDEVHHLPANSYAATLKIIKDRNPESVHVGFTATPERMDDKDVFEFFGNQVTFELPLFEAKTMGYLTPMKILQCDGSINPKNKSPILPGTELHETYLEQRYLPARYPDIVSAYRNLTKDLDEKKTLILAPNNDKAEELANYFTNQSIPAVALTSKQKTGEYSKDYFDEHYQAWTNGQWNEGSVYIDKEVPKVAVAVDMFREGVDVPDIGCLLLWRYTNSLPLLLQMIGRGLRPSPGKTHLVIGDLVGQSRNLEIMQFLADSIESNRKGTTTIKSGEEFVQLAKEYGVEIGDEVAESFDNFFKDIPAQMVRRYRAYHRITSPTDHQKLEEYIQDVCNENWQKLLVQDLETDQNPRSEEVPNRFYDKLDDAKKVDKSNADFANDIRAFFLPAFYPYGTNMQDLYGTSQRIPVTAASEMVYFKIYDLLSKRIPEDPDHTKTERILNKLFPEFDPDKYSKIKKRASNLRTLRVEVFNKYIRKDMMQALLDAVFKAGLITKDKPLYKWLEQINAEMDASDEFSDQTELLAAEELKGDKLGHKPTQDKLIELYSMHPRINNQLSVDDFELEPEKFRAKLKEKNLLNFNSSLPKILSEFNKVVDQYINASEADSCTHLKSITQFLSQIDLEQIERSNITQYYLKNFVEEIKRLKFAGKLNLNTQGEDFQEFFAQLDKVIEKFISIASFKDSEDSSTTIINLYPNSTHFKAVILNKEHKYPFLHLLSSHLSVLNLRRPLPEADFALKTDNLGRTNICLRGFEEFEILYDQATNDAAKQKIIRAAIDSFELLLKDFDLTKLVFIIGKKTEENRIHDISAALAKHLRTKYNNDVIIGASFWADNTPIINEPFDLSADSVIAPLSSLQSQTLTKTGGLKNFYTELNRIKDLVQPTILSLKTLALSATSQTPKGKAALDFLKSELDKGICFNSRFENIIDLVKTLRSILDSSPNEAELNEEQIRLSAVSIFFCSQLDRINFSTRKLIQSMLMQYSQIIRQTREHDALTLPEDIFNEMQEFLDFTINNLKTSYLTPEDFHSYIKEENCLFKKINTLYIQNLQTISATAQTKGIINTSSVPVEAAQNPDNEAGPPFFDKRGEQALWITKVPKKAPKKASRLARSREPEFAHTVHWDRRCQVIKDARSQQQDVEDTTYELLGFRGENATNSRGCVILCQCCRTDKNRYSFGTFKKRDYPASVIESHGES